MMSVDWSSGYQGYDDSNFLSNIIDRKDGLAEFIIHYVYIDNLPKELQPAARELREAYVMCRDVFTAAGVEV